MPQDLGYIIKKQGEALWVHQMNDRLDDTDPYWVYLEEDYRKATVYKTRKGAEASAKQAEAEEEVSFEVETVAQRISIEEGSPCKVLSVGQNKWLVVEQDVVSWADSYTDATIYPTYTDATEELKKVGLDASSLVLIREVTPVEKNPEMTLSSGKVERMSMEELEDVLLDNPSYKNKANLRRLIKGLAYSVKEFSRHTKYQAKQIEAMEEEREKLSNRAARMLKAPDRW